MTNMCILGGTMKSTILVVALTFSSLSVFAETNDIMCGIVKKVTTHDDGARIEFTDGSIVKNVTLNSHNSPFITASMTSNITVCFKEYGMNSIFSASK